MASRVAQPLSGPARAHLASLEKKWSGSLHLAMLAAPLRKCVVTAKILPTSLMVQLKAVSLPPSPSSSDKRSKQPQGQPRIVMLPDQLLHPQFMPKRAGKGLWLTLDAQIYAQLERKRAYKVLNPTAVVGEGVDALIARQLGERVCQEVQLLQERFGERKRFDLITNADGAEKADKQLAFTIALTGKEGEEGGSRATPARFRPEFTDDAQADKFATAIKGFAATREARGDVCVLQSHLTAPLGIALYRLDMWTRSKRTAPKTAAAEATRQSKS